MTFLAQPKDLDTFEYGKCLQSGRSSPAKHGDAYFSDVSGFMKDPIAAAGPFENQEV